MQLLLCGPCIPMQFVFTVAKPNSFIYEAISAPAAIIKNSSPDGLHWRRSQYWVCVCPKAPSLCLGPLWLRSAIFLLNSEIRCTQLKNTYWCFLTSSGDLTMRGWDHFWCPSSMSLKYSLLFFLPHSGIWSWEQIFFFVTVLHTEGFSGLFTSKFQREDISLFCHSKYEGGQKKHCGSLQRAKHRVTSPPNPFV